MFHHQWRFCGKYESGLLLFAWFRLVGKISGRKSYMSLLPKSCSFWANFPREVSKEGGLRRNCNGCRRLESPVLGRKREREREGLKLSRQKGPVLWETRKISPKCLICHTVGSKRLPNMSNMSSLFFFGGGGEPQLRTSEFSFPPSPSILLGTAQVIGIFFVAPRLGTKKVSFDTSSNSNIHFVCFLYSLHHYTYMNAFNCFWGHFYVPIRTANFGRLYWRFVSITTHDSCHCDKTGSKPFRE